MADIATINIDTDQLLTVCAGGAFEDVILRFAPAGAGSDIDTALVAGEFAAIDVVAGEYTVSLVSSELDKIDSLIIDGCEFDTFTPQLISRLRVLSASGCGFDSEVVGGILQAMYAIAIGEGITDGFINLGGNAAPDEQSAAIADILIGQFAYKVLIDGLAARGGITATDIANFALARLGGKPIANIAGSSIEAISCRQYIDLVRRQVLTDGKFTACTKAAELSAIDVEVAGWENVYQLPSDFLVAEKVICSDTVDFEQLGIEQYIKWEIRADKLLTNLPAVLHYIADVDYRYLSGNIIEAISCLLAGRIAQTISGDRGLSESLLGEYYQAALHRAIRSDADNRCSQGEINYNWW